MSVYIKGMEMPKAGNRKTIRIYYDGTCAEPNWQGDCRYMQGCEAVPVPPHGRLIDADTFYELLDGGYDLDFDEVPETKRELLRMVTDAPTIIPAEAEASE